MCHSPVRLGLVGTGAISRAYGEAMSSLDSAKLVCACDSDPKAALDFASATGATPYTNLREMLLLERLDGVIVCTPPSTHEAMAGAAMDAGLHVLCEKPLSVSIASAGRMTARAMRRHVLLTMASKFRFVDDVRAARDLAASGLIGEIVLIENAFTSSVNMARR
jgi:predicted dehydrogenase